MLLPLVLNGPDPKGHQTAGAHLLNVSAVKASHITGPNAMILTRR